MYNAGRSVLSTYEYFVYTLQQKKYIESFTRKDLEVEGIHFRPISFAIPAPSLDMWNPVFPADPTMEI